MEFTDAFAFNTCIEKLDGVFDPFTTRTEYEDPYYVLVELSSNGSLDELETALWMQLDEEIIHDECVLGQTPQDMANIWHIRENCSVACNTLGEIFSYDFSCESKDFLNLKRECERLVGHMADVCMYGHVGDGNIHIKVMCEHKYFEDVQDGLEPAVFEWLKVRDGSISAEHGLGQHKGMFLDYAKDDQTIDLMKRIKKVFDPKGILNPYKVIGPKFWE